MDETHKANLKKLADYLSSIEPGYNKFDMGEFMMNEQDQRFEPYDFQALNECGTSACAAGHSVDAGIVTAEEVEIYYNWMHLIADKFGVTPAYEDPEFRWLFGSCWANIDNTPVGAAARIYEFLESGVPSQADKMLLEDLYPYAEIRDEWLNG